MKSLIHLPVGLNNKTMQQWAYKLEQILAKFSSGGVCISLISKERGGRGHLLKVDGQCLFSKINL